MKDKKRITKSSLAIELSKLKVFIAPDEKNEQYPTDSEVAAELLWFARMRGDIEDKRILDLGCGTGILGIGALLLGARECIFVDNDPRAIAILMKNLETRNLNKKANMIEASFENVNVRADLVLQNPPFGTRKKHIDMLFLKKAFALADIIYSFHKTSTIDYIQKAALNDGFNLTHRFDFAFPLKATLAHHTRKIHRIEVSAGRFERENRPQNNNLFK